MSIQGRDAANQFHPAPKRIHPAKQLPPPPPTDASTRARMQRQPMRDTKPETLLRKELHALGLRFRIDRRPLPDLRRTADVIFPSQRVAVFVDGCFWHGCSLHARPTKSNTKWWAAKIEANKRRDRDTTRALETAGWLVIRVWEHESPAAAASRVQSILESQTTLNDRAA